jgi:hypothetical protein
MNLFHYCSNASFLAILRGHELFAPDLSLANDRLEGKWIREIFLQSAKAKEVSQWDLPVLESYLDYLIETFGAGGVCFSEEEDLLSQWRGYAEDGAGVSIGLSQEFLEELHTAEDAPFSVALRQVIYDPKVQEEKEITEAKNRLSFAILTMFPHLYTLKNPAFREEREWRLISYMPKSDGFKGAGLDNLEFISKRDRIVPVRRISMRGTKAPSISKVVLGPRNITPTNVIKAALTKYEFKDVEIAISRASYR